MITTIFKAYKTMPYEDAMEWGHKLIGTLNERDIIAVNNAGKVITLKPCTCVMTGVLGQASGYDSALCEFTLEHRPEGYALRTVQSKPSKWNCIRSVLGLPVRLAVEEHEAYERKDYNIGLIWREHSTEITVTVKTMQLEGSLFGLDDHTIDTLEYGLKGKDD